MLNIAEFFYVPKNLYFFRQNRIFYYFIICLLYGILYKVATNIFNNREGYNVQFYSKRRQVL